MKYLSIIPLCILFVLVSSCDSSILDKNNPNQLSTATFFKTSDQAISAVNAIYSGLQANNLYNREYFFLQDLLSDDMQSGGAQLEAARARILNYVFDGSNPLVAANWRGWYRIVLRANLVIQNVPDADESAVSPELKKRLLGEARFLRGWAYFELVSLWGPVPLIMEPSTTPDGVPRAGSEDEIYQVIFDDLNFAATNLPNKKDYSGADVGRACKEAAQALAAKAYMYRGEYDKAKPLLQAVIDSPSGFKLVDRYLDNFQEENENNSESIFEVQFSTAFGTADAWNADGQGIAEITFRGQEYGPNAWRNIIPSDGLVAEFETVANGAAKDDPRSTYSFFRIGDTFNSGQDVLTSDIVQGDPNRPSWKKYEMIYKQHDENSASGINFRVIRYADVLLMMAEVENETGSPSAAVPYLNQVRDRADVQMPHYPTAQYPTGTKEEVFKAIKHERRVELNGEQIRNRDIRRWRRQGKLDSEPISGWQSKYDLLPIPYEEIDNNSAMDPGDQNSGY